MKTNIFINKDFSKTTLDEAIDWTLKNCSMNDVRKRLRSRAVAWVLLKQINNLQTELQQLKQEKL